jgi:hypothetical protein
VTSSNIANEPSGSNAMLFVTGSLTLNYLPGFDTGFLSSTRLQLWRQFLCTVD